MSRTLIISAIASAALLGSSAANAGVYTDDLGKCLVNSSSTTDRTALVQWIFSALALHPDVKIYSNISPAQRKEIDAKSGALFERLLTVDCRAEAVNGLKYEGQAAIAGGFELLGKIAAGGLMTAPEVQVGLGSLMMNMDMSKIKAIADEAGVKTD